MWYMDCKTRDCNYIVSYHIEGEMIDDRHFLELFSHIWFHFVSYVFSLLSIIDKIQFVCLLRGRLMLIGNASTFTLV